MIKIFYGDNRIAAKQAIDKFLGPNYEIVEGKELSPNDLPSLLLGQSLFASQRNILIRDISDNKAVFEKISDYLNSPHNIVIFEIKLDKRSSAYKTLKNQVEIKEFTLPKDPNLGLVFDIYKTAKEDGKKAIQILAKIKPQQDPMMFFGLMASQAIKDFTKKQGTKEKKALKELSKLDQELKSSKLSSWLLIESFLLRLSSL